MTTFSNKNFGICGKSVQSATRNVVKEMLKFLPDMGYRLTYKRSESLLVIQNGDVTNDFYIFGGLDESSQDLVQGITLAGIFLDEVALMPKSFVDQATGRCSVDGRKLWFSCNPEGSEHYFKRDWIDRKSELNLLYLHFTQEDNLSLTEKVKEGYRRMYTGAFFQRYILGRWVAAEGLIYSMWSDDNLFDEPEGKVWYDCNHFIGIDYGTTNPMEIWTTRK